MGHDLKDFADVCRLFWQPTRNAIIIMTVMIILNAVKSGLVDKSTSSIRIYQNTYVHTSRADFGPPFPMGRVL